MSVLAILARWMHTVALSLWLGGLVAIGAFVAPVAFRVTRTTPAFAGNVPLQNAIAGGVVGGSLHIFVVACTICGVLLLLSNALLLRHATRKLTLACLALSALLLLSALYLGLSLTPALDAAQRVGDLTTFDRLHHLYEAVSSYVQMPLLLALALSTALRDTPRRARAG